MDVKEFYEQIGGSYEEALSRLMNDVLIEKFILKFKETQRIKPLEDAIKSHDYEQAFFLVHTLKGVVLNLAFKKLGEAASELTELIRGELAKTADPKIVEKAYEKIEAYYLEVLSKSDILPPLKQ